MSRDTALAEELLIAFLRRTGVPLEESVAATAASGGEGDSPAERPSRYLWTDAFAVCTLLGLYRRTGRTGWLKQAQRLAAQVHEVLGHHRADDARSGWISGFSETEGARHPTVAGLRIGKPLPERGEDERFDRELEWERDGQYYHYLTRWTHALNREVQASGDGASLRHASELATAAHRGFSYRTPGGELRLYWKMSIDLERPLVPSMGQHDPLDGLVASLGVEACRERIPEGLDEAAAPRLDRQIRELATVCADRSWATDDPLGVGGLLVDAFLLARLLRQGRDTPGLDRERGLAILEAAIGDAGRSVASVARSPQLDAPADRRLAFRELGLSLGLAVGDALREAVEEAGVRGLGVQHALDEIADAAATRARIHAFWIEPSHREGPLWLEHRDINDVMLSASLDPLGYLGIESPAG